jgi:two-component system nitrogen regulation response regulator GlnG
MVIAGRPPEGTEELPMSLLIEKLLAAGTGDLLAEMTRRMERLLIKRILEHTDGNQRQAAQILGITRGCLRHKLPSLGITITCVVEDGKAEW